MKVLILAGGLGSRLSEETTLKPKPMVEIGGQPILWHIMKIYSYYGFNEFVILGGYKSYVIKEYFSNYYRYMSDLTFDMVDNKITYHSNNAEPWKVTVIDTGENTMTGGRIKRAKEFINNEPFMLTYGDGVGNVNIKELLAFHKNHGKSITLTSVQPEGRFGALEIGNDAQVLKFSEKPKGDGFWINAGFFVCEPNVLDYIDDDTTVFENEPLNKLATEGELFTYRHKSFWQPMDTLRDKMNLDNLIDKKQAPWITW